MKQRPLELSRDFKLALEALEKEGQHLFVTGRAGTGKSTLLQLFRRTTRKRVAVLAPTGIAALHIGGQTIHSFFGFPPRMLQGSDIKKRRNRKLYQRLDLLVIDEISMVRADLLDAIDLFLRKNREDNRPFGGLQVAFFGDLFQLPPVVADPLEKQHLALLYDSPYFFSAHVLRQGFPLTVWELTKVYRQENREFLSLLERIRLNETDGDVISRLNERFDPAHRPRDFSITLTARNATANALNQKALAELKGPPSLYTARITGNFKSSLYPADSPLILKEGAQVMCVKNDPERQFVNGTLGRVIRLDQESAVLLVKEEGREREVEVQPMEWEMLRYRPDPDSQDRLKTESIGSFTQLPLRLAWAVTIHKAQGKTFEQVVIDLGRGAFEHGQTYVALSRCTRLDGIVLRQRLRPEDILVDPRIVDYYRQNR